MKTAFKAFLVLAAIVQASSFAAIDAANTLVQLKISKVETRGYVFPRSGGYPMEVVHVGIPVEVRLPDACTEFVGQELTGDVRPGANIVPPTIKFTVKGARSSLTEACIQVLPRPVETHLVLPFTIFNNGFVPAGPVSKLVQIGDKSFQVRLDPQTNKVTIVHVLP